MKHLDHPHMRTLLLACCLGAANPAAHAQEVTPTTTTETTGSTPAAIGASTTTEAKLSTEFSAFLGGDKQAGSVISGLRQGTAFTLDAVSGTTGTSGTSGTTTTTIDPPTGTMGYGNVRITLRLAQSQLNALGITEPTTEQLSAVLLGGDINGTPIDGILTLRAEGMGWGQIAQQYGTTVGQLMGKGAVLTKQTTSATSPVQAKTPAKITGSGTPSQTRSNGYIPSTSKSTAAAQTRSNGFIPSGKSAGAGIVSAAGGSLNGAAHSHGQASKGGAGTPKGGLISTGGQHVSAANPAGGGSSATAPGQARKN